MQSSVALDCTIRRIHIEMSKAGEYSDWVFCLVPYSFFLAICRGAHSFVPLLRRFVVTGVMIVDEMGIVTV